MLCIWKLYRFPRSPALPHPLFNIPVVNVPTVVRFLYHFPDRTTNNQELLPNARDVLDKCGLCQDLILSISSTHVVLNFNFELYRQFNIHAILLAEVIEMLKVFKISNLHKLVRFNFYININFCVRLLRWGSRDCRGTSAL